MLDVLNEKTREVAQLKSENSKLRLSMQEEREKLTMDVELKVIFKKRGHKGKLLSMSPARYSLLSVIIWIVSRSLFSKVDFSKYSNVRIIN